MEPLKNIQFPVLSIFDQEKCWYFWKLVIILDYITYVVTNQLIPFFNINLRVNSLYRINEITGCFLCRDISGIDSKRFWSNFRIISGIYLKRFWGNFRIIPQIYKCEAFAEPFKFVNQL